MKKSILNIIALLSNSKNSPNQTITWHSHIQEDDDLRFPHLVNDPYREWFMEGGEG